MSPAHPLVLLALFSVCLSAADPTAQPATGAAPTPAEAQRELVLALPDEAAAKALRDRLAQAPPAEAAEFRESLGLGTSPLGTVITLSYDLPGLISFLTAGQDEVRAWTIPANLPAQQAAGAIHTDLSRGFIRAEVINWQELLDAGSNAEARKRGQLRSEGKGYIVQDGDVVHFRFNV